MIHSFCESEYQTIISFCDPQKKASYMGLEQHEGDQMNFSFKGSLNHQCMWITAAQTP